MIKKMNQIKFSHLYTKMPKDYTHTTLLEVFLSDKKELSKEFIEYDTGYFKEDFVGFQTCLDGSANIPVIKKYYPLQSGKLIVLLLQSKTSMGLNIWTTVRRWTIEKEKYYKSLRGKQIECIIEE